MYYLAIMMLKQIIRLFKKLKEDLDEKIKRLVKLYW